MQGIRVTTAYSGRLTRGAVVMPGRYLVDDPRVCGPDAVAAMLAKGFAERIELDAPEPGPAEVVTEDSEEWQIDDLPDPEADDDEEAPYTDYDSMNVKDLRALMEARGIEEPEYGTGNNGAVLKRDLIAALTEADAYAEDEEGA